MPSTKTITVLKRLYRSYYKSKARLWAPHDLRLREVAIQPWGLDTYKRHLSVRSLDELRELLAAEAARHAYYSSARYRYPDASDMDSKGWMGADLVFDIDADHLPYCTDIVKVPVDGKEESFTPNACIKLAAEHVVHLVDVLEYELGIPRQSIRVEFSGHRGFHVVAYLPDDSPWLTASSDVRRELVNYLKALDLDPALLEINVPDDIKRYRRRVSPLVPSKEHPGIRGRLARIAYRLALREGRIVLAEKLSKGASLASLRRVEPDFEDILMKAKDYVSIEVDEQVTIDTKRLIRIPGSLNGKTSLPVIVVDVDKLDEFTVTSSLSPFNDLGKVTVRYRVDTPKLEVLGEVLASARSGERRRLPAPIALYLASKGVVDIVEVEGVEL